MGRLSTPIRALAKIVGEMHDETGKVAVPGFYGRRHHANGGAACAVEDTSVRCGGVFGVGRAQGIPRASRGIRRLSNCGRVRRWNSTGLPGDIRASGSKTVIPAKASVKVTCRIVPGQNGRRCAGDGACVRAEPVAGGLYGRVHRTARQFGDWFDTSDPSLQAAARRWPRNGGSLPF